MHPFDLNLPADAAVSVLDVVLGNPSEVFKTSETNHWWEDVKKKPESTVLLSPLQEMPASSSCLSMEFSRTPTEQDPNAVLKAVTGAGEKEKDKKKRKRKITDTTTCPRPKTKRFKKAEPKELPVELQNRIREMGGDDPKCVIQKYLRPSDVSQGHNRLSIPVNQVLYPEFLRDDEKEMVKKRVENRKKSNIQGINAELVLDHKSFRTYHLCLKQWDMKSSTYNLVNGRCNNGWYKDIVKENNLKAYDVIQLWSFRVESQLRFALVKIGPTPEERMMVKTGLTLALN